MVSNSSRSCYVDISKTIRNIIVQDRFYFLDYYTLFFSNGSLCDLKLLEAISTERNDRRGRTPHNVEAMLKII